MKLKNKPIIISASRATDIPNYYSQWFFNQLKSGGTKWINPFNSNQTDYISFKDTRLFIFWSKNPKPMIKNLNILDSLKINYYFHFTLNDYENENFEPNIPLLKNRIDTFIELSNLLGKKRVIWRYDPLILTPFLNIDELIFRIKTIGDLLITYTNRLIFSFIDIEKYKKVKNKMIRYIDYLNKKNILNCEFTENEKLLFGEKLNSIFKGWKKINPEFEIFTCGENINLEKYDIFRGKCIDDDLILKLFPDDNQLMKYLNVEEDIFGNKIIGTSLKHKGQRKECNCIVSKDIGFYNSCPNNCIYCYANYFQKTSSISDRTKKYR